MGQRRGHTAQVTAGMITAFRNVLESISTGSSTSCGMRIRVRPLSSVRYAISLLFSSSKGFLMTVQHGDSSPFSFALALTPISLLAVSATDLGESSVATTSTGIAFPHGAIAGQLLRSHCRKKDGGQLIGEHSRTILPTIYSVYRPRSRSVLSLLPDCAWALSPIE